ncbi:MAG: 23S rRNA (adenine(1618)-N(6))-methyltransferase RlmF [Saprospiraceae bacterium]|nr:23S rRNA (adenine(1618)-N(6))-methyltransferase RlmF [Saprospiraceae bacterium]
MSEKQQLHPRNKHQERYDFPKLIAACPDLAPFVHLNKYNDESIDFFNPNAVKTLNKALLKMQYGVENWDIPQGYLCPPIPSRADYLHYVADLLSTKNKQKIPIGRHIKCLDIGVGANCIYPLIGHKAYGWTFIGSDIDPVSIHSAENILASNPSFQPFIELRLQTDARDIINGILKKDERIDLTICNPPFHASLSAAQAGTQRKIRNLKQQKNAKMVKNFGGQNKELWCSGGEVAFIQSLIAQSKQYAASCFWYTTLVSKETSLKSVYAALDRAKAVEVHTLNMQQGNKISRVVAWTYLSVAEQKEWVRNW